MLIYDTWIDFFKLQVLLKFLTGADWLYINAERLSDNDLIPSFYRRYVDDTLAIMPGLDAAENALDVLKGVPP